MFEIENEVLNEMSNYSEENYKVDDYINIEIGCNPCSGSCGSSCLGGCAGSCRGTCTFSCSRYNR